MQTEKGHIDWFILVPVLGLMLFSIAFVYSASAYIADFKFGSADKYFWSHSLRVFIGIGILLIFAKIDYHIWIKFSKSILLFSIALLIIVLFVGDSYKGASRWLSFGPISFQPSELAKFALVLHFATMLTKKQQIIKELKNGFLPFVIWILIVCFLIALQPNFSTMFVIFLIAFTLVFIGNANLIHIGVSGLIGLGFAVIFGISADYRLNRIMGYLGLTEGGMENTVNYQLKQSLLALGNGGMFGVGPGQNKQSHLFLPESYGDFIFSIIGEEYGFLGVSVIIAAFAIIFWRGMLIAKKAPDHFGYFLAIGILITFAVFVVVNAGVNTGLLPTTGVPMPFVSYGGTAIFIYAGAIGVLLNISAQAGIYPKIKESFGHN